MMLYILIVLQKKIVMMFTLPYFLTSTYFSEELIVIFGLERFLNSFWMKIPTSDLF